MADAKKRYLIVPDEAWSNATLVSATSQAGLTVKQPETDTALGDMRVVVSGEPTEEFSTEITVDRYGLVDDTRYYFDEGLSDGQIWGRTPFGLVQGRPDALELQTTDDASRSYFEPIGWHHHTGENKVSLLVQVRPYRFPLRGNVNPVALTLTGFGTTSEIRRYVLDKDSRTWSQSGVFPLQIDSALSSAVVSLSDGSALLFLVGVGHVDTFVTQDNFLSLRTRSTVRVSPSDREGQIASASACVLPSGRILLGVARSHMAHVYYSDDNGLSWQANTLLDWNQNSGVADINLAVSPSGMAVCAVTYVADDPVNPYFLTDVRSTATTATCDIPTAVYLSVSGEAWSGGTLTNRAFRSATPAFDDEGRFFLVGSAFFPTCVTDTTGATAPRAYAYCFANKEIVLGDDPESAFSVISATSLPGILAAHNIFLPLGSRSQNAVLPYSGIASRVCVTFLGGNCYAASGVAFEELTESESSADILTLESTALRVHVLSTRSNLLEAPKGSMGDTMSFGTGSFGRQYLSVWDGTEYPDVLGWTRTAAGGSALVSTFTGNARYVQTQAGAAQTMFWDSPSTGFFSPPGHVSGEGMVFTARAVVMGISGGSALRDEAAIRYIGANKDAASGSGEEIDLSLRFVVSGTGLAVFAYDNVASGVKATYLIPEAASKWVEVLFGTFTENDDPYTPGTVTCFLYYRIINASAATDVDHMLIPFDGGTTFTLAKKTPAVAKVEVTFGHMSVLNTTAFGWKGLHFNFPNTEPSRRQVRALVPSELVAQTVGRLSSFYPDPVYDQEPWSGQPTGTRAAILPPNPSYLLHNVHISGHGRSLLRSGVLSVETEYVQSATNVLPTQPVLREYRSEETQASNSGVDEVSMVYELSGPLTGTALALFGRNTPSIRIQGHSSNTWGSPLLDVQIATPYDNLVSAIREYGHLYVCDKATSNFLLEGNRVRMAQRRPWRAHQFKSQDTGQQFYAVLYAGFSQTNVYRIIDNTDNVLQLDAPNGLYSSATHLVIYSDRVAFDLGTAVTSLSTPITHIRVIFQGCRWPTSEQQHHKLGALWFGHLHDLSEPDFNWQWQRTTESGNTLTETPAGPTYSKRNRQFRRRFLASKPIMKSALVSNGIDSPQQQIRGSWEETINLLERLEVDGTRCALIWQGERAEAGAQSSPTQRTADPLELIACRVESAGTLQNDAYTCQTMTLASTGSTDVPRPRASIAQIVFKEEF